MPNQKAIAAKKDFVYGKYVIGIDPAKAFHQAALLDPKGIQIGKSFSFRNSHTGFANLLKKARQKIPEFSNENTIIAIETSCNLWQVPVRFFAALNFKTVLVSPLSTKHARPLLAHEFSHTDPKDAYLVADNTKKGHFDFYQKYDDATEAMHKLSITYDKLRKNYVQDCNRIHSLIDRVFPEFFKVFDLDSKTALYLLGRYFLPTDFLNMDIDQESKNIEKISRNRMNSAILEQLQALAQNSIGIRMQEHEILAERMNLDIWLKRLALDEEQMQIVIEKILHYARQKPYFEILISVKGISNKMAALFIAETRGLERFNHYKQLEKHAGYSLRIFDSGKYSGARHMNHIGNKRLAWIVYKMTEETAKYIPEVRVKFLKRKLAKRKYKKTMVACASNLLRLIFALVRDNRPYDITYDNGCYERMYLLEKKYTKLKELNKTRRAKAVV